MYHDTGEPTEKCGELNFGLEYDYPTQTLKLKMIQVSPVKVHSAVRAI